AERPQSHVDLHGLAGPILLLEVLGEREVRYLRVLGVHAHEDVVELREGLADDGHETAVFVLAIGANADDGEVALWAPRFSIAFRVARRWRMFSSCSSSSSSVTASSGAVMFKPLYSPSSTFGSSGTLAVNSNSLASSSSFVTSMRGW